MPAANPAVPRFRYIAHRVPPEVFKQVFRTWATAVGADGAASELDRLEDEGLPNKALRSPDDQSRWWLNWVEHLAPELPQATAYDRYIPWLASFYRREYVELRRAAEETGIEVPEIVTPPFVAHLHDLAFGPALPPKERERMRRLWSKAWSWRNIDYETPLRLLADWAQATGIDLQRHVQTRDDLARAKVFAADWHREREDAAIAETDPGSPVIFDFGDGWTVVLLNTPEALRYEGKRMRHCIGDYADPDDSYVVYYSLRDPSGRPRVSIEHGLEGDWFTQVKGFANEDPDLPLLKRVAYFRLRTDFPQVFADLAAQGDPVVRDTRVFEYGRNVHLWQWFADGRFDELVIPYSRDPHGLSVELHQLGGQTLASWFQEDELLRALYNETLYYPPEVGPKSW